MSVPGLTRTRTIETYTIPEAAEALGRSLSNFRRWLTNELVPAPVLSETTRATACYCAEELEIICRELNANERDFANLCASHTEVITRMSQAIHGFRDIEFGHGNVRTR